jgi:hypothetical protein
VKSDIATEVVMRSPGFDGAPVDRIPLAAGGGALAFDHRGR